MSEFVRILLANKREVSVNRVIAEAAGSEVEILDTPATNGRRVLPESRQDGRRAKPKTTVKKEAAKKASRKAPSEPGESTTADGVAVDQPQEA